MEQRRTLLLIDPDDGQQVLFYVPSLLCARALLYETLVLQVAEEESKRQAMEAAHRAREEEGAYDATRPVGEGAPEPEPEQVATAVPLAPEGHEISEEEAMARVAALEAERAAMEAADEAEDAAPAWGLPDEPGPPA
jgi:hypothetical protein